MAEEDNIQLSHLRRLGYCSRGIREFCKRHGLDYSRLLKEGVTKEEVLATGDSMAIQAVEEASK